MNETLASPPIATQKPYALEAHGTAWDDPWFWLRDPSYPTVDDAEILAYLTAENAYFESWLKPHAALVETLFQEMKGRIKEDDKSVPQKDGDWLYWTEFETGAQYRKWYRSKLDGSAPQLILDEPALAEGKDYFRVGAADISDDGTRMAWSVDDNGSERYAIRFKALATDEAPGDGIDHAKGQWGDDQIEGSVGSILFTPDGRELLYGLADEQWRSRTIKLHVLGTPPSEDIILYHEPDEGFSAGVSMSQDRRWIMIETGDNETSEVRLYPADNPRGEPILVAPRVKGREYSVETHDDQLFILTNDDHVNFRVATAPIADPGNWTTLIPGSDDFYITDISSFKDFFVVEGREQGLDQIEIRRYETPLEAERIAFPEASYSAGLDSNPEYDVKILRLSYESMVTPDTIYDYDVSARTLTTLKVQEIPSGYDASAYVTERISIKGRDGTMIPVSLVYKKGTVKNGANPLHLYAYGAYGYAVPPGFSTTRLSLVDRGTIYAIAHIRGGDDLGRNWYLQGKLDQRINTFTDFIDVAEGLAEAGYTARGRISASGGSAGGELMGAIANMAPDLWGAIAAHVPFVDVVNTMMDETLPLTPGEWPEWGNPITDKAAFEYIKSYSPYDNVEPHPYPPMLVTAGLNDPRVTYWEPAKWVAKLRVTKTDKNLLLLKTNMGAGHGGKSGRFESLREDAEEFAFILTQMGSAA